MKKTFRTLLAGALALFAVSCYDDSALREDIADLDERLTAVEATLNAKVNGIANLATRLSDLEGSVAVLDGKMTGILSRLDAIDGTADGVIKDLEAAIAALKEADKAFTAKDAELAAEVAKIAVVKVEDGINDVVLTLADGSKVTLSKPASNVDNSGLVTIVKGEDGKDYWAVVDAYGHANPLGVSVAHPIKDFAFKMTDAGELQFTVDGSTYYSTGVKTTDLTGQDFLISDVKDNETNVVIKIGDAEYTLPKFSVTDAVLKLSRTDFFLRYSGTKTVDIESENLADVYVISKPDGWKAVLADNKLTVTAPSKKAVEVDAAEAEGQVLLHATDADNKCIIAKVDVKAGPGLTLKVGADGSVTVENSYYGTSVNMWGEESFGFTDFILGMATPALFKEDPKAYVQVYNDTWNAPSFDDIIFPSAYNFAEQGIYEEGVYETDVVKTTVADAYFAMFYQQLPAGAHYVVWVAPTDSEGKAVIEDMVYTEYVNVVWNVAVKEVTHSDITVTIGVEGASRYVVNAVAESSYNSEWNPMTFEEYMNAPMGGPWNGFKSYGAAEALGQVLKAEEMPEEIKLSEILGQKLAFGENYKIWVMPILDHLAIYDEANSMPEYDYYVYDYSAFDFDEHFLPYVIDAKTNDIVAGGAYAAELKLNSAAFTEIRADVALSEGTELCYYAWYTPEEYAAFDTDAKVMEALFMDCMFPLTESGEVSKSYINPGDKYVLATVSIGTDGKYGEIVDMTFSSLAIPYDENVKVELVSAVLDEDGKKYTVTVNVTGASKVMGYNLTHSDYYYSQFPLNVCKNGHKASYSGYQMADVVDGKATLVFDKSNYKKDYYVAAYNVTDGVVSAISSKFVVEHLFD